MIVMYWMTADPITVTEDRTLMHVLELCRQHKIRRLPVVRDGNVVGIVGLSDLLPWVSRLQLQGELPAKLREELADQVVSDAMTPEPVTVDAYDHLEVASAQMQKLKVGAFPVLNRGHLVGMISETDMLRALTELSYLDEEGKRITLKIPLDQEFEVLYQIVDLARRCGLELLAVLTHPILDESLVMTTLRVRGQNMDAFVKTLWENNYKVADIS